MQQWSLLMDWASEVYEELGKLACLCTSMYMVSMTAYWDIYKLDILMAMALAIVIAKAMVMTMAMMMISDGKPPSMVLSPYETHTVIGDFTHLAVSNSDNNLHLLEATSTRFGGQMPDILEVQIWRTVSLWMFLLSHHFYLLLYFIGSRPSINGIGRGFYHLWRYVKCRWSRHVCRIRPLATIWYWSVVGLMSLYVCVLWMVVWLFPVLLFDGVIHRGRSAPTEGNDVMAQLHITCPGPGNTSFIHSQLTSSLRSLAIFLPLYYSTVLSSTFATISTDISSYMAIHQRMPIHSIRLNNKSSLNTWHASLLTYHNQLALHYVNWMVNSYISTVVS